MGPAGVRMEGVQGVARWARLCSVGLLGHVAPEHGLGWSPWSEPRRNPGLPQSSVALDVTVTLSFLNTGFSEESSRWLGGVPKPKLPGRRGWADRTDVLTCCGGHSCPESHLTLGVSSQSHRVAG